jgi:hypothetical protein
MTVKGKDLLQVKQQNNFNYLSTGKPTDANKIPDLLDFAITNEISDLHTTIESNLDLEADHSTVTITKSANIIWKENTTKTLQYTHQLGPITNKSQ